MSTRHDQDMPGIEWVTVPERHGLDSLGKNPRRGDAAERTVDAGFGHALSSYALGGAADAREDTLRAKGRRPGVASIATSIGSVTPGA